MSAGQALKSAVTGEKKQRSGYEVLRDKLAQVRGDLRTFLGSDQAVARFERVVLNAVQHNPDLLTADGRTLMLACMKAAQDRLLPDGKEAVLNIYNTKIKTDEGDRWVKAVQYLPMVRGLIKLLWDTNLFTMIDAVAVNQKDYFAYERGDNPKIDHAPYSGDDDPGPVVAAYFIGKMKTGEVKREVMFRRDIEKARAASKTPDKGPWNAWYDQMAIKSVIHRVYKQLPSMPEIEQALVSDITAMNNGESVGSTFQASTGVARPVALPEHAGGEPAPSFGIDTSTGEYIPANQSERDAHDDAALAQGMERKPEQQQTTQADDNAPTLEDAIAMIKRGDDDSLALARDIGKSLGKLDVVNDMIANRKPQAAPAAEEGQQQERPRGRRT